MKMSADMVKATIARMLEQGVSPLEGIREFGDNTWLDALREDLDEGGRTLLEIAGRALREEMNSHDMDLAIELWLNGWKSETPHATQKDVMSWYWRAPSKRAGKPGRRYLSTHQAHRALKKFTADK
jgi:hypothetical protein